jgi:hypothetical protein
MVDKLWEICVQTKFYLKCTHWACCIKGDKNGLSGTVSNHLAVSFVWILHWVWFKPSLHVLINSIFIQQFYFLYDVYNH